MSSLNPNAKIFILSNPKNTSISNIHNNENNNNENNENNENNDIINKEHISYKVAEYVLN